MTSRSRCDLRRPRSRRCWVDDDGLAGDLASDGDRRENVRGRAAIHAHRNDFWHVRDDGEGVGQWLTGTRRPRPAQLR